MPRSDVESTKLLFSGVEGDRQNDLKHHGGPERAVCIYSLELIDALIHEGHPIKEGHRVALTNYFQDLSLRSFFS